jgi:hypothetical protein
VAVAGAHSSGFSGLAVIAAMPVRTGRRQAWLFSDRLPRPT